MIVVILKLVEIIISIIIKTILKFKAKIEKICEDSNEKNN